jgi:stage V sporulation protein D (sporulation-specific penicillin-binding protein)
MNANSFRLSRARMLVVFTVIIMGVFILRLFYLQVIRHSHYVEIAMSEQMKQLVIPAKRGEIYALDGGEPVKLVLNQTVYTVFADPMIVDEPDKVIETIKKVAGGSARSNLEELLAKKDSRYQILATNVTRRQAELIKEEGLVGVGFQEGSRRVYPEGQLAAQVLGFVDAEGNGRYGVEGSQDERLKGEDGMLQSVTDIRNVPLTIGDKNINKPAKNGDNLVLTIDRNIQSYAEQALKAGLERTGAQKGSVLVMDPQTGEVKAMANLPTYNPTEFNKVEDISLFNNPIISVPYEPGSNIKTLTMVTGIDRGVVGPESTYNNTDYIQVEDRTITNATKGQTGVITMQHALNYSLNTGFVTIVRRLGDGNNITLEARQTLYEYFHDRFGLGQPTGIELSGEASGIVVPPDDPNGAAVRYSNMSFGQGMDVTTLQVAAAFSSIINGGNYYQPTVIAGTVDEDGEFSRAPQKDPKRNVVSPASSDAIRDMVVKARQAFYAGNDKPGYQVGGKTGTSQAIKNGEYVFNETVGSYLGFGGDDIPRYVIMVEVSGENMALEGGKHAMPIFTDISNWMIDYLQLQPRR